MPRIKLIISHPLVCYILFQSPLTPGHTWLLILSLADPQDLKRSLQGPVSQKLGSWSQQLSWIEHVICSTAMYPFQCSVGYKPLLFRAQKPNAVILSALAFVCWCHHTWMMAEEALAQAPRWAKAAANNHRTPVLSFVVKWYLPRICLSGCLFISWQLGSLGHTRSQRS